MTMNGSWFYNPHDRLWKPASEYGSERSPFMWQSCGLTTVKGNRVYFHPGIVTATHFDPGARSWQEVAIGGIKNRVQSVSVVASGKRVEFVQKGARLILRNLSARTNGGCNPVIRLDVEGKPMAC